MFSKSTFLKNSFRNTIRVSTGLDPDQDLIWVQTVCKGYQQKTKVSANKEMVKFFSLFGSIEYTAKVPVNWYPEKRFDFCTLFGSMEYTIYGIFFHLPATSLCVLSVSFSSSSASRSWFCLAVCEDKKNNLRNEFYFLDIHKFQFKDLRWPYFHEPPKIEIHLLFFNIHLKAYVSIYERSWVD